MDFAPAPDEAPSLTRVIVTTLPETAAENVPSIPELAETAVVPPTLKVKPAPKDVGNVTTIFPSAAIALSVVNVTTTFPEALATKLAGSTSVEVKSPDPEDSSLAYVLYESAIENAEAAIHSSALTILEILTSSIYPLNPPPAEITPAAFVPVPIPTFCVPPVFGVLVVDVVCSLLPP